MKKLILYLAAVSLLASCVGKKQIERQLHSGDYDRAISNALKKLENNKDKKRKREFIVLLENAYVKVVDQDLNTIQHLKKDGNPEMYKRTFDIYQDLEARQNAIKAVLPLTINGRKIQFDFNDYSQEIVSYRSKVSSHLYEEVLTSIHSKRKSENRTAFRTLEYIDAINPNYKDIRELKDVAHFQGTDFIIVSIENDTRQIIPRRLEEDLLNFDTYGLNKFWSEYHSNTQKDIEYDYAIELQLKNINVSPERINEREFVRKRQVVDGWKYKLDANGNVLKDSLGNDIKIDKIITVKCRYAEFNQTKSTQVVANVEFSDLKSNRLLESFPIASEFIFENLYAIARGDKRALNDQDRDILRNERVYFPSDEEMVYETGEDLKLKLQDIINSYNIND
ncbi:MAG: hypothetical protein ACI89R_001197 [Candidatus Azotimanducaceae bacterium]|jgi:hypothetical protein